MNKFLKKDYIWSFTTYFTQGFPFTITRAVVPVFLRDMGVALENIGLTSLYGLPWILKFLWAPQVDSIATKRTWLLSTQFFITLLILISAIFVPLSFGINAIATIFFIVAIVSATSDIAIDGYYMAALDKDGQAKFVGYRVMAYRIAMMAGTGIVVTIGTNFNWISSFITAGIIMAIFATFHFFFLSEVEKYGKSFKSIVSNIFNLKRFIYLCSVVGIILAIRVFNNSTYFNNLKKIYPVLEKIYFSHMISIALLLVFIVLVVMRKKIKNLLMKSDSDYSKAFFSFINRDGIGIILFFVIMLRVGEWSLSTMQAPFIVDLGIKTHYGWISGFVGLPASIVGAMVGGWAIYKIGLKKVIWPFILAQNLTNVVYMFVAIILSKYVVMNTGIENPTFMGFGNLTFVASMIAFDQFAGGLGSAVLMTYIMRICSIEFKATHYAIGTGLMNLSGMFAGIASGFIAAYYGYAWTFGISFLLSVPAMLVIPFLPKYD